jgi:hypothetical protein
MQTEVTVLGRALNTVNFWQVNSIARKNILVAIIKGYFGVQTEKNPSTFPSKVLLINSTTSVLSSSENPNNSN